MNETFAIALLDFEGKSLKQLRATIYKKGAVPKIDYFFLLFFFLKLNSNRSQKKNFRPNGVELTELYPVKSATHF